MRDQSIDLVWSYLGRFIAYPNGHARVAHALWLAHTHLMDVWDTTPRLAFMSQEPASGKTMALEMTELFVPDPVSSFNMSSAVVMRLVAQGGRTLLYDEIDQIFGNAKRQESNGDLCGYMNAGYRRGAKAYRCTAGNGKKVEVEEFNAFAPVAVSGLRTLPDSLASRAVIIRMHRAIKGEVSKFRHKLHRDEAKPIKEALAEWCEWASGRIAYEPSLPDGIEGRAADIWEPLIAIADVYGGPWPKWARDAAVFFVKANAEDEARSAGVELLAHIKDAFGGDGKVWAEALVDRLCAREESPWQDLYGKPLDKRGLSKRLKPYGIKSKDVRLGEIVRKGYAREDFQNAWERYLPASPTVSATSATSATDLISKNNFVADVADVAEVAGNPDIDERAAILEFDGGLTREEADAQAAAEFDGWEDLPESCRRWDGKPTLKVVGGSA
jgi:uncharacterized protein DUF3631